MIRRDGGSRRFRWSVAVGGRNENVGEMPSSSSSLPGDTPVAQLARHDGPVKAIRFTDGGKYCLTAGHDHPVCLWNPTSRDPSYHAVADPSSSLSSDLPRALPMKTSTDWHTQPVSSMIRIECLP
mmetsp:Transcript_12616/g.37208  ORF Transcript_12616/g.37208 Transcript_12616/m.37208 type:complete len:125 (-) Transcript_12616:786-1160(-)